MDTLLKFEIKIQRFKNSSLLYKDTFSKISIKWWNLCESITRNVLGEYPGRKLVQIYDKVYVTIKEIVKIWRAKEQNVLQRMYIKRQQHVVLIFKESSHFTLFYYDMYDNDRNFISDYLLYIKFSPIHVVLSSDCKGVWSGHVLHVVCPKKSWKKPLGHTVHSFAPDEKVSGGHFTEINNNIL